MALKSNSRMSDLLAASVRPTKPVPLRRLSRTNVPRLPGAAAQMLAAGVELELLRRALHTEWTLKIHDAVNTWGPLDEVYRDRLALRAKPIEIKVPKMP